MIFLLAIQFSSYFLVVIIQAFSSYFLIVIIIARDALAKEEARENKVSGPFNSYNKRLFQFRAFKYQVSSIQLEEFLPKLTKSRKVLILTVHARLHHLLKFKSCAFQLDSV